MDSKVGEKGQVTIPKKFRDSLGIKAGDVLEFEEKEGRLVASKRIPEDPFTAARGILRESGVKRFGSTEEYMAWVRPHRFGAEGDRMAWAHENGDQ
jgi:AbrB family looped-hinge helix DNA binding protein